MSDDSGMEPQRDDMIFWTDKLSNIFVRSLIKEIGTRLIKIIAFWNVTPCSSVDTSVSE
jgi:hypothetical protein